MTRPACDKFQRGDLVTWWHKDYQGHGTGLVTGWHYHLGQRVYYVRWLDGSEVMGRGWQFDLAPTQPYALSSYKGQGRAWQGVA